MTRDIDQMELPRWYDENTLTMLVVNPNSVFLYWELAFGQTKTLQERLLVLKLYELSPESGHESENPRLVQSVELPPLTNDWYFHDLKPACRYRAEMGWENGHRFYSFIKSNIVEVPPASPVTATALQPRWQPVEITTATKATTATTTTGEQPVKATVQELIDSMSFYMGIKKDDSPERK
ncbi:MAG TPA: DUF4912 domain-containing protein [Desulfotomaculum sp.]|nr:MAG: hypothetical protein JL56_02065 [Desulfotomaculum sp. BICA1-6]HBX24037.1 DUF4912 domain-containing protein [Desulfotomaculum sp.]